MNDETITLKSVNDLLLDNSGTIRRYFIAAYQRGYRWSPLQVTQLLEDIREFARSGPKPEEFYCLQPLVLKVSTDGCYEVVDGQQRLATVFLILRYFNDRLKEEYWEPLFSLEYKTRPELSSFLFQPTEVLAKSNVDYFHLFEAFLAIKKWFSDKGNEVERIKDTLLNKTKVIWYQLPKGDNPVEAFTRLNVGKIPLTNDELIRALFLKRVKAEESEATALQIKIATDWDYFEKRLQTEDFWYFLSNRDDQGQNRIGFLFDLVARLDGLPSGAEHDAYGVFYAFSEKLKGGADPALEWRDVKNIFMLLDEWFEDRTLYHIIGFLVNDGLSLTRMLELSDQCPKSKFEQILRREIFARVIADSASEAMNEEIIQSKVEDLLDTLEYGKRIDRQKINKILLLFNLATLLQNPRSNMRFQFDKFKREEWNIEHVRSVASDKPERHSDQIRWLAHCIGYLQSQANKEKLRDEIKAVMALPQREALEAFDPLYDKLLTHFKEKPDEESSNDIANLALLDAHTNKSYKNAVFAVKRRRLLKLDKAGIFVPICTRNVFLKAYSLRPDNVMFWSTADQEAYKNTIIQTLVGFFSGKTEETI